jgi:hypothetical protein
MRRAHTILAIYMRNSVLEKRHVDQETGKFHSTGTSKKYPRTVYSGSVSDRKVMKKYDLPSTRSGIHHACMRCIAGIELHACMYELASCFKGAAGSQNNMPEWCRDAGPPGPFVGRKPPCVSDGHHVCSAKQKAHHKSPTSHMRY